jgi:hypothetical protein
VNPVMYTAEKELGTWTVRRWLNRQGVHMQSFGGWRGEAKARALAMLLQDEANRAFSLGQQTK